MEDAPKVDARAQKEVALGRIYVRLVVDETNPALAPLFNFLATRDDTKWQAAMVTQILTFGWPTDAPFIEGWSDITCKSFEMKLLVSRRDPFRLPLFNELAEIDTSQGRLICCIRKIAASIQARASIAASNGATAAATPPALTTAAAIQPLRHNQPPITEMKPAVHPVTKARNALDISAFIEQ